METIRPNKSEERKFSSVLHELTHGVQSLIKSEIKLARAEAENTVKDVGKQAALAAVFAVIALAGTLPFIAFLVIGLGKLLNNNYWLSSLIVSVLCIVVGGVFAALFAKRISQYNFKLPQTKNSLQYETDTVKGKIQNIKDSIQRRAS